MELEVVWTTQANEGLSTVLRYLEKEWTKNEILNFQIKLEKLINRLLTHPTLYPKSKTKPDLRRALIDKNNYIIYRLNLSKKRIEIINLRGTRQKPL